LVRGRKEGREESGGRGSGEGEGKEDIWKKNPNSSKPSGAQSTAPIVTPKQYRAWTERPGLELARLMRERSETQENG
jgi:hypothetical protein